MSKEEQLDKLLKLEKELTLVRSMVFIHSYKLI